VEPWEEENARLVSEIERNLRFDRRDIGRFVLVVIALAAVMFVGCGHHRAPDLRPAPPPKVEAHLDAFPPITISGHVISLHAWLEDPAGLVGCPSIEWTWPDGTHSAHVGDCDPDDRTSGHSEMKSGLLPSGEWRFGVAFRFQGREWRAETTVEVH
jgi:hypothetical protein